MVQPHLIVHYKMIGVLQVQKYLVCMFLPIQEENDSQAENTCKSALSRCARYFLSFGVVVNNFFFQKLAFTQV